MADGTAATLTPEVVSKVSKDTYWLSTVVHLIKYSLTKG